MLFAMPTYRKVQLNCGTSARRLFGGYRGETCASDRLKGKGVILNFWTTWCRRAVEETPALNRLQKNRGAGRCHSGSCCDEDSAAYEKFLRERAYLPDYRDPLTETSLPIPRPMALRCILNLRDRNRTARSSQIRWVPAVGFAEMLAYSTPSGAD